MGAPLVGENREAGAIPARSRHCDEDSQSQETCPNTLPPFDTRAKVSRQLADSLTSPANSLFLPEKLEVAGFRVYRLSFKF